MKNSSNGGNDTKDLKKELVKGPTICYCGAPLEIDGSCSRPDCYGDRYNQPY